MYMTKKRKKFNINFHSKEVKIISTVIGLILIIATFYGIYRINSFKTISKEKYTKIMKKSDLEVYDVTDQFGEDYVESATIAYNKKVNYQIEFIVFSDTDYAKNAFNINKNTFLKIKTNDDNELSLSNEKISYYGITTNDKYMYVSRRKNTLIYLSVDGSVKTEVQNLVTKLGY